MKKLFALIFIVAIIMNTIVTADMEAESYTENNSLMSFIASVEIENGTALIPFSEISRGTGMDFRYNPDTGLLFAGQEDSSIYIKISDGKNIFNNRGLVLGGQGVENSNDDYSMKLIIYYLAESSAMENPAGERANKAVISADAIINVKDGKANVTMQKIGTSHALIDSGSINDLLKNNLILVNKDNTLAKDYFPKGLTNLVLTKGRSTGKYNINSEALEGLDKMLGDAYAAGVKNFVVTSSFRTYDKQNTIFNNKVGVLSRTMYRRDAIEEASKVVAVPGTSEHQTGLAVDICNETTSLIGRFGSTPQGKWLYENSWKYGYVIRYPEDKTQITGIINEPWHIRYVGKGHSEFMKEKNLCLEEYVQYIKDNRIVSFNDRDGNSYIAHYIDKDGFDGEALVLEPLDGYTWSISELDNDGYALTLTY
ncbi:MAG: D-alanyl-D-alanine carboxypeptidase family protein [Caulobacteraceae bacterium]